jgi:hypothetical protein
MNFSFFEWHTETMIFENSKEVQRFLAAFEETKNFFILLKGNQFNIKTKDSQVIFYFKHKTRDEYNDFILELRKTEIFKLLYALGWKLKNSGSGESNASSKTS